ncbi:MAG: TerB family tellurite resistance protein [Myxococcota bacterium]|nr:TerB family tellurite resistance protein [Myxococcota bacterium]
MSLFRFLGLSGDGGTAPRDRGDSETVQRIVAELERLPAEQARHLATFSYVLARVANADLQIDASEIEEMQLIVRGLAHLSDAEASLVVEIARTQAQHLGGTENYVVTRAFREQATREQRGQLLECLYAVAAADGTISGIESNEILKIAEELGFTRPEAISLRASYREHLSEFQNRPTKD